MAKRKLNYVVIIIAIILAAILFWLIDNNFHSSYVAQTEIYIVQPNDTFWNIAEQYREKDCWNPYILSYMEELQSHNPELKEKHNQLNVGDKLTVIYYIAK